MIRQAGILLFGAATLLGVTMATAQAADGGYLRKTNGDIAFANYPRGSLERGEQGTVGISVKTDKKGRLLSCAVTESSGYAALDQASCDLLITHARLKPFLSPDGRKIVSEQPGRIVWRLPDDRQAALAAAPPPPATASKNMVARAGAKQICRTQSSTGSLVRTQKICLTKEEWQRQYRLAQEETQDMRPKFLPGG